MGELQATMTNAEFLSWQQYFEEAPFDDHHRYHRPALLVAQSMAGGDIKPKLEFLVPPKADGLSEQVPGGLSQADLRTIAALGVELPSV